MDPHFGLPLQFPSAFAPIPVDHHTHEGRYLWDPRTLHPLHHAGLAAGSSNANFPDLALLRSRVGGYPYRLSPYMDYPATPFDTRTEYLQQMAAIGQRCMLGDCHSISPLHSDIEGSTQLASPRPRHGRKRALSASPYLSDSLDLSSMIRFSPSSLASYMNGSRSSSASGSYGHLSAGTLSPALGVAQQSPHFHPFLRQGGSMMIPFGPQHFPPAFPTTLLPPKMECMTDITGRESACNIVSSTVEGEESRRLQRERQKEEKDLNADIKDEPDFIETNCHWSDCSREFPTQDDLVKHINDEHIHGSRKQFICKWKECSRDAKPFKAQYMLVVHMRRHTGEKPHQCTFEGCSKAYSRLENLKTHLRSHTGEKPYTCEFPGCTKAFSNASDRAKHQNRTHSNAKPYACKAPGCTKRYTDPSSLRKHVKTVHGNDFYANKKHKGGGSEGSKGDDPPGGSPQSGDSNTTQSLSSPSTIKSENSPAGVPDESVDEGGPPISDNSITTTSGHPEALWDVVEESLEESISVATCFLSGGVKGESGANRRNRFKSRLQAQLKSASSWFPSLLPSRRGSSNNRRPVEPIVPTPQSNLNRASIPPLGDTVKTSETHVQNTAPVTCVNNDPSQQKVAGRRHSGSSSTVSSFYSSMQSEASSQQLSTTSAPVVQPQGSSAYDPISAGSSRRSSESGEPLPNALTAHLHRVHARAIASQHLCNTSNLVVLSQNDSLASDAEGFRRETPIHPNQNVLLEQLEEGKPIEENKDVLLPDDMVNYLNEQQRPPSVLSDALTSVSRYVPPKNVPCRSPQQCTNHQPQTQNWGNQSCNCQQGWSSHACSHGNYGQHSNPNNMGYNNASNHPSPHNHQKPVLPYSDTNKVPYGPESFMPPNNMQSTVNSCYPQNNYMPSMNQQSPYNDNQNYNNMPHPHHNQFKYSQCGYQNMNNQSSAGMQNVYGGNSSQQFGNESQRTMYNNHGMTQQGYGTGISPNQSMPSNYSPGNKNFAHNNTSVQQNMPYNQHNINQYNSYNSVSGNSNLQVIQSQGSNQPMSVPQSNYYSPNGWSDNQSHNYSYNTNPNNYNYSNNTYCQNGNIDNLSQNMNNLPPYPNQMYNQSGQMYNENAPYPPCNNNNKQGMNGPCGSNGAYNSLYSHTDQAHYSESQQQSTSSGMHSMQHHSSTQYQSSTVIPMHQNVPVVQHQAPSAVSPHKQSMSFNSLPADQTQQIVPIMQNSMTNVSQHQQHIAQSHQQIAQHQPVTMGQHTSISVPECLQQPPIINHPSSHVSSHLPSESPRYPAIAPPPYPTDIQSPITQLPQTFDTSSSGPHAPPMCLHDGCCSHKPGSSVQAQHSASSVSEQDEKGSEKPEIQCQSVSQSSLSAEAYNRTLQYVQQCREMAMTKQQPSPGCNRVSSSTDRRSPAVSHSPLLQTSNMVINDLNSGLHSLVEETRYLQLLQ